ncbi:MAG: sulfatase-like hydrolase/transferase [Deltaproteobacteria bacterium]|nr:sulfatase-like hydrolase/transferase [Deltaproteobacteria bacterium]
MNQKREALVDLLHLFVLSGFALAQPLYDSLSRQAEFFVARRSEPLDFVVLAFVLSALIPATLALMEWLVDLVAPALRKRFHTAIVALLMALVLLPALKRFDPLPAGIVVLAAAGLGAGLSYVITRFRPARSFLTVLSPSILFFPVLFLFHSPVTKLLLSHQEPHFAVEAPSTTPVVLVVFDEFCVTSLMNQQGRIDPIRYPNFAAFADDATWFRNATTVGMLTNIALPAILTGRYPTRPSLPHASDFPNTLFTLLGASYDLHVIEPVTDLCPHDLCEGEREPRKPEERIGSLMLDLSVIYPHLILPGGLANCIPSIAHAWGGFIEQEQGASDSRLGKEVWGDRGRNFLSFVDSIQDGDKPKLHFHHTLLPHAPYDFLPSGKKYSTAGWACGLFPNSEQWREQEEPVVHAHQRYLLQVGFVDQLVGKLVRRLKKENLYDRSLILLTSDHGVSFIPGDDRRGVTEKNLSDILSVLLMIKKPHQHRGEVSDRYIESVDILPTIGEILNVSIPWSVDGRSAFSASWAERTQKTIFDQDYRKHSVAAEMVRKEVTLERQLMLFGSGNQTGPFPYLRSPEGLIGKSIEDLGPVGQSDLRVLFENEPMPAAVDPEADFVPCHLLATIQADRKLDHPLRLAIAVNGVIRAVASSYEDQDDKATLSVIVPDSSFHPGFNRLETFVVATGKQGLALSRTNVQRDLTYTLLSDTEGETVTCSDGKSFPVVREAIQGILDVAEVTNDFVRLEGWAADIEEGELPALIVLFSEGVSSYVSWNNLDRPDVAEHFDNSMLTASGFRFWAPLGAFEGKAVRVFALSNGGAASELGYSENARWVSNGGSFLESAFAPFRIRFQAAFGRIQGERHPGFRPIRRWRGIGAQVR